VDPPLAIMVHASASSLGHTSKTVGTQAERSVVCDRNGLEEMARMRVMAFRSLLWLP
jgi:hypothetical protein